MGEREAVAVRSRWMLHPFFVGMGGALLIAAFFTDLAYASNSIMQWANFSAWLIAAGLVLALLSLVALAIDTRRLRPHVVRWHDFVLLAVAALVALVDEFVHTRDGWTSVMPAGIVLSAVVALPLIVVGLRGWRVIALPGEVA